MRWLAIIFAVLCAAPACADAVADFYAGRTIGMIIGSDPGGSYDLNARLVAAYLGKYIPGHPAIVPQNLVGAGGIVGANHVVNVAAKDGTVIGATQRLVAFDPLLGDAGPKYDPLTMRWLGSTAKEPGTLVVWHTAPHQRADELFTRELIVGGTQPGTDTILYANVLNNVLGTKLKIVGGYAGSVPILLAMERGEVQGVANWSWSDINAVRPNWLRDKQIRILLQIATKRIADLPDVPTALEFAKSDEQRAVLTLLMEMKDVGRPFFMAPSVPQERFAAIEAAFISVMNDREFVAENAQQKRDVEPVSGAEMSAMLTHAYGLPKAIIEAAQRAVKSPAGK
jgi:tripartite-type tricarboxylate transporter receptor subunit TctC